MKKILSILVMLMLLSTVVLAQGSQHMNGVDDDDEDEMDDIDDDSEDEFEEEIEIEIEQEIDDLEDDEVTEQHRTKIKVKLEYEFHPSSTGLENAMARVRTEEQAQHLEQVMNMIQERHRERLGELDGLVIEEIQEGNYEFEGLGRGKFLGIIKLGYRYRYQVNEETGELNRVEKPFDFLFTDLDEQLEVESQ